MVLSGAVRSELRFVSFWEPANPRRVPRVPQHLVPSQDLPPPPGPVLTWGALQQAQQQGRPPADPPHLGPGPPAPAPAARRRLQALGPQVTGAAAQEAEPRAVPPRGSTSGRRASPAEGGGGAPATLSVHQARNPVLGFREDSAVSAQGRGRGHRRVSRSAGGGGEGSRRDPRAS